MVWRTAAYIGLIASASASAEMFVVNKTADDGSAHTLRWAIEQNNANPKPNNRIQVVPTSPGQTSFVIKLNSLLPPIIGPVIVEARDQRVSVVLDGSNFIDGTRVSSCPGTTGGFGPNVRTVYGPALAVVDSGNVEIQGFEIHDFCIGILSLRSHDNYFHHNLIHQTSGGAGILITGDDGTPAGGATVGLSTRNVVEFNTIHDTGDGMECTRGTSYTMYQHNILYEDRHHVGDVPYSQGIECAGAGNDHIVIQFNVFSGYSDGLQLNAATNTTVIGNTITGTTYGITSSGTGVTIENNVITGNRMGVGPTNTSRVTITRNQIYNNGQPLLSLPTSAGGTTDPNSPALLGIDVGVNGVSPNDLGASCADGFPDCTPPQNFPVLSSSSTWGVGGVNLVGTLPSRPNAMFRVEFFANHRLNTAGFGEGEVYLGSIDVTTGPTGIASFNFAAPADPLRDGSANAYFTATATNASGQTSEFSHALQLNRSN
jgi:3-dehydroshikimate dehydratase